MRRFQGCVASKNHTENQLGGKFEKQTTGGSRWRAGYLAHRWIGSAIRQFADDVLADTLYGEYAWYFRGAGLIALLVALVYYFRRKKGICTIDEVKRRRNEILNSIFLTLTVSILGYLFFLYVVVHYIGVFLNLWA